MVVTEAITGILKVREVVYWTRQACRQIAAREAGATVGFCAIGIAAG